jgi:hypothetical protein
MDAGSSYRRTVTWRLALASVGINLNVGFTAVFQHRPCMLLLALLYFLLCCCVTASKRRSRDATCTYTRSAVLKRLNKKIEQPTPSLNATRQMFSQPPFLQKVVVSSSQPTSSANARTGVSRNVPLTTLSAEGCSMKLSGPRFPTH